MRRFKDLGFEVERVAVLFVSGKQIVDEELGVFASLTSFDFEDDLGCCGEAKDSSTFSHGPQTSFVSCCFS